MKWKVKEHPVTVAGRVYKVGDIIESKERPTLEGHIDERAWESLLEPVSQPKDTSKG